MFEGLNEDELIQLLSSLGGAGGSLPGKTPAAQLNYYQDLVSTLGFDPVQAAGSDDPNAPPVEEYTAPLNKQRFVYESDPQYKQMFDLVDKGASPATAVSAAGIKDEAKAKEAEKIVADYAFSVADELNSRQTFEAKNASKQAKYTAPDGSKYKNAPLGGPTSDIMASASEYDLMGQPTIQDFVSQLAGQKGFETSKDFVNTGSNPRSAAATYTTPARAATPDVRKQMGDVDAGAYGQMKFTPDEIAYAQSMQKNSPYYTEKGKPAVAATSKSGGGPERSWEKPSGFTRDLVGGSSMNDAAFRNAVSQRQDKAKATQVRSDANTNAMRRILALRTVLGG